AGYDDVPPEGRSLQTGSLLVDSLEGPMAAQAWFTYERIGEILAGLGSSKEAILLVGGWLTDFRQWPIMNPVRQQAFPPDHYPVSTTFGVPGVNCPGAVVLFDALALSEGPLRKERIGSARQVGSYFPGSQVGPFLFLAGEVPADPERGLVVRGYD